MHRPLQTALLAVALALGVGGCGLGPGSSGGDSASLTVTRDFGSRTVLERTIKDVPSSETVMRSLQRQGDVKTRYGGGFVQCVNGLCGGADAGRRVDWFYFVNGIEASKGAASVKVSGGDHIWWDRRSWEAADRVPAVVGAFPEPFLHGTGDERLPVRVECLHPQDKVCGDAQDALVHYDISASKTTLRSSIAGDTLRVVVGTWDVLREDGALQPLEDGPSASGVYAEPRADAHSIALLDARGRVVRTLGAGSGLVAATRIGDGSPPVWTITGTDEVGLAAAVRAFNAQSLKNHYAVAVEGSTIVPVPITAAGS